MYYKHCGLGRQRTEDKTFFSMHLQAGQFLKNFTTHVVS